MGRQPIVVQVCILYLAISISSAEIHRAKVSSGKVSSKLHPSGSSTSMDGSTHLHGLNPDSTYMENTNTVYTTWMYSIAGAILVGLSGIFPLLVIPIEAGPSLKHGAAASRLKLLLSFAVGGLLGDVFLHLLPEAWEHIDRDRDGMHWGQMKIGLWVLTGILSFLIIEKIFAKEGEFDALEDECDEEEDTEIINNEKTNNNKNLKSNNSQIKSSYNLRQRPPIHNGTNSTSNRTKSTSNSTNDTSNSSNSTSNGTIEGIKTQKTKDGQNTQNPDSQIKVSGWLNLAANVIDNFTHGLAVAGSFSISTKVGMTTTFAILIHEVPHEVGDFAILLRSGFDRWKAAKAQLLTASGGVLGAITALAADSVQSAGDNTAWILPFTSGGFMYIALVTVVPDLLQEKHRGESLKQIFMMVLGIAIMAVVSFYH